MMESTTSAALTSRAINRIGSAFLAREGRLATLMPWPPSSSANKAASPMTMDCKSSGA